jgi:hypothetical protein
MLFTLLRQARNILITLSCCGVLMSVLPPALGLALPATRDGTDGEGCLEQRPPDCQNRRCLAADCGSPELGKWCECTPAGCRTSIC